MKLTRRIAVAGACAAIAGGALLAGGSPALAATPGAAGHLPVHGTAGGACGHHAARQATDPWIADQLATFYPSSTQRAAVFDPWVKDQLALFPPASR
ncbi:hypothetical protein [Streptomyces sp. AGS-58]|uniref:hypothetical protein n=1 Tax=unclassified Streptomyces TaxID=2593676 RepID=UPI0035A37596